MVVTWDTPVNGSVSHYILIRTHTDDGIVKTKTFRIDGTLTVYIDNDAVLGILYDYVLTVHYNEPTTTATTPPTATATATPVPTATPIPTATATPVPTDTPTPTATATTANTDSATDRSALVALYNATDGANWVNNTNWLSSEPIGEWFGVTTNEDGRVTRLNLWGWSSRGYRIGRNHSVISRQPFPN